MGSSRSLIVTVYAPGLGTVYVTSYLPSLRSCCPFLAGQHTAREREREREATISHPSGTYHDTGGRERPCGPVDDDLKGVAARRQLLVKVVLGDDGEVGRPVGLGLLQTCPPPARQPR